MLAIASSVDGLGSVETWDDNQELDDEQTADPQDPDLSAQCFTSETIRIGSNTYEWILVTRGKHGGDLNESRIRSKSNSLINL